jgi:hypothetical protein
MGGLQVQAGLRVYEAVMGPRYCLPLPIVLSAVEAKSFSGNLRPWTLVDRDAVSFLKSCEADGVELKNCPAYIRLIKINFSTDSMR